ncbi:hypothetical protein CYY_007289 [Polysphondylium violaceum]|uniref:Uncharacterized protein n=1 Tax=Polysphondylium violaceum TaxID=133409 RepID=A0A8J4PNU6_9MYCE|nr:hypothetical protein CYY_007289 [Polysphondylium violaceum]
MSHSGDKEQQIQVYVRQLFTYYYNRDGISKHIDSIVGKVLNSELPLEQVPLFIESLAKVFPDVYILINKTPDHILQQAMNNNNNNNNNSQSSSSHKPQESHLKQQQQQQQQQQHSQQQQYQFYDTFTNTFNKELFKQLTIDTANAKKYVDELNIVYTGKIGDPATTQYLVKSLVDGSFSPTQAELQIKFSKEAKQHGVSLQIKQDKKKRAEEYIYELYKLYFGASFICPLDELHYYTNMIVEDPHPDYQSIEDDIKEKAIMNVQIPIKKPPQYK